MMMMMRMMMMMMMLMMMLMMRMIMIMMMMILIISFFVCPGVGAHVRISLVVRSRFAAILITSCLLQSHSLADIHVCCGMHGGVTPRAICPTGVLPLSHFERGFKGG